MKKKLSFILLFGILLINSKLQAQCSVTISANDNNGVNTTVLNCTNSSITLTANPGTGSVVPITYSWGGTNSQTIDPGLPGTYTVSITDANGCTSSSTVVITEDFAVPVVRVRAFPETICNGQTSTLVALGASTYVWTNDQNTDQSTLDVYDVSPLVTTRYAVTGTGINGCTAQDFVTVVVNGVPGVGSRPNADSVVCVNGISPRLTVEIFAGSIPGGSIQWYKSYENRYNGFPISNQNSDQFYPPTDTIGTAYYYCKYTEFCASEFSIIYKITVTGSPVINLQPSVNSQTVCINGSTIPISVAAAGYNLHYQWYEQDGAAITPVGTDNPFYYIDSSRTGGPFYYYCDIENRLCNLIATSSLSGPVTIKLPTVITSSPNSGTTAYCLNTTALPISVTATGDGILSYQWYSNSIASNSVGNIITGAISDSYIPQTTTAGRLYYYCVVNGGCGADTSNVSGAVTIGEAVVITAQPSVINQLFCPGATATQLSVSATGATGYQWYVNNSPVNSGGTIINGGTGAAYTPPVNVPGIFYYYCIVTGTCSSETSSVSGQVKVYALPSITNQSTASQTYCLNETSLPLSVTASGDNINYQWYRNTTGNTTGGDLVATGPSCFPSTSMHGSFYYYCVVSGACPPPATSVISGVIIVNSPPQIVNDSLRGQSLCLNGPSEPLSVSATGTGILQYKWFKNTSPDITGATLVADSVRAFFYPSTSVADTFYYYCVVSGNCLPADTSNISGAVIINPLPAATISGNATVCQNSIQPPVVNFAGASGTGPYTFVYNITGTPDSAIISSTRNDSAFIPVLTNTTGTSFYNLMSVTDNNRCWQRQTGTVTINVINKPSLQGSRTFNICDSVEFNYTAQSSSTQTNFTWIRNTMPGNLRNIARSGAGTGGSAIIKDTLDNITSLAVAVPYIFTLTTGAGCVTNDSVIVTVNPTPRIDPLLNATYCNGNIVFNGIPFTSPSPDTLFSWVSDKTVGFGTGPSQNITGFIATNPGITPLVATVSVKVSIASNTQCTGDSTSFKIVVNPSAPKPDFTWLDINNNTVCSGAKNINFNVSEPGSGISYTWETMPANSTNISIRDNNNANTAISFLGISNDSIKVIATNNNGGCRDSMVQRINVINATAPTDEKIILKQPGSILIYPDNTMNPVSGYQWGYDSLITPAPDYSFSEPKVIEGQVYQFFIPDSNRFFSGNKLDTARYKFWVLLQKGGCYTKVYFNGPYAGRPIPSAPAENNSIQLSVLPNPNNGIFDIVLKGNMYGSIHAEIYNAVGQVVFTKLFVKNLAGIRESIGKYNLPNGLYYIVLNSSDLKKATSRFIIQR